jgi:hypothetical protein
MGNVIVLTGQFVAVSRQKILLLCGFPFGFLRSVVVDFIASLQLVLDDRAERLGEQVHSLHKVADIPADRHGGGVDRVSDAMHGWGGAHCEKQGGNGLMAPIRSSSKGSSDSGKVASRFSRLFMVGRCTF